jgi:hypothetical protein
MATAVENAGVPPPFSRNAEYVHPPRGRALSRRY